MKQTLVVKLAPTSEQHTSLLRTMERSNVACGWLAGVAFANQCANKFALQKLAYRECRERFGLSAQMAIRAISKVVEAYKRDKRIHVSFRPHGAITYDERIYSFKGPDRVSLLTLDGRIVCPYLYGAYQAAMLDRKRGQADLLYRDGAFYLSISVDAPEPTPNDPANFIGVDLGIVRITTASDGTVFPGDYLQSIRARFAKMRAKLQRKGARSAKRKLKRRSGRERRFQTDINHAAFCEQNAVISKTLVARAKDTANGIALEDLKGIRMRVTVGKGQRRVVHSWAFGQLRSFVSYKARLAGVRVVFVDPRNTSRTCPECGCIDKKNRKSQAIFSCVSCGYSANADENAARIISVRAGLPCHAA